ncbi:MAG: helicase-related protein [Steroidobacteraceae bacterium]
MLPLYGELAAEQQDAALAPATDGARRVILATNIAETSLTVPGVRVVVDSGLVRRAVFDPVTGMSRLETQRISRASADQRQERAGRTEPGTCLRLWSEGAQRSLAPFGTPEIAVADLAPLALDSPTGVRARPRRSPGSTRRPWPRSPGRARCSSGSARSMRWAGSRRTAASSRGCPPIRASRTCGCAPAR